MSKEEKPWVFKVEQDKRTHHWTTIMAKDFGQAMERFMDGTLYRTEGAHVTVWPSADPMALIVTVDATYEVVT